MPCICKEPFSHLPLNIFVPYRHTFGADKERFKNSIFGRLDLAAEIPGKMPLIFFSWNRFQIDNLHVAPGCYDDIFRYSINRGRGRTSTGSRQKGAGTSSSPVRSASPSGTVVNKGPR